MIRGFRHIIRYQYTKHFSRLQKAIQEMQKTGKFVNEQLMENEKLQLWALYKQATQGDAKQISNKDTNEGTNISQSPEDLNRYEAWLRYKGKSKEQAQQEYIAAVRQLLKRHGYDKNIDF